MADMRSTDTDARGQEYTHLSRAERAAAALGLVVVLLLSAIVLVTRPLDPPWLFVGLLVVSVVVLLGVLRHSNARHCRLGLAAVGACMVGWGLSDAAGVGFVTPYAAVLAATGATSIGAVLWTALTQRARPPGDGG